MIFPPSTSYQSTPTSSRVLHPGLLLTSSRASHILSRFSHPPTLSHPSAIFFSSLPAVRTVSHVIPIPALFHPSYPCGLLSIILPHSPVRQSAPFLTSSRFPRSPILHTPTLFYPSAIFQHSTLLLTSCRVLLSVSSRPTPTMIDQKYPDSRQF